MFEQEAQTGRGVGVLLLFVAMSISETDANLATNTAKDADVDAELVALPKVQLHIHLVGSVRMSTLAELLPADATSVLDHFCVPSPVADLGSCLDRFAHLQALFSSPERIERFAAEAVADAAAERVVLLELRYSPVFFQVAHPHLKLEEIHK